MRYLLISILLTAFAYGCGDADKNATDSTTDRATSTIEPDIDKKPAMEQTEPEEQAAPQQVSGGLGKTAAPGATAPKTDEEVAVLTTNHGRIVLKFFNDLAPGHVDNFKKLAKKGFYDGTKFHRVIPGFMIQGGDPNSKNADRADDGTGGPGYQIKAEFNKQPHTRGILSMARSQDPNSAGSQFFITVDDANFLDGQYTAFGQVVEGMDVADKIVSLERDPKDNPLDKNPAIIKSVKIEKWPLK